MIDHSLRVSGGMSQVDSSCQESAGNLVLGFFLQS